MKIAIALVMTAGAGLAGLVWLIARSEFISSPFGDYGKRGGSDL
jgi:hypothetical protein